MWLSQQGAARVEGEALAQVGTVSIPGSPLSVFLSGERRRVGLFAAGGYYWKPLQKESVLVLGCGEEENLCLLGAEVPLQGEEMAMLEPGEVYLSVAPKAGIYLRRDGGIHLTGQIFANGVLISAPKEEGGGA